MSRLVSASNPESGYTCYTYDADGNVGTRTFGASACPAAGSGVTTTYTYDALDQLTGKTCSDGTTPAVSLSYFQADWLHTVTVTGGTVTQKGYDGLGRITSSSQTPSGGSAYSFSSYGYNRADEVTSMTMPSGRVMTTTYDPYGRASELQGSLSGVNTTYLSSPAYAPHGAMISDTLGKGLYETTGFNNQLQASSMMPGTTAGSGNVWSLSNLYLSPNNNGNVPGQSLTVPGASGISTAYNYDGANRLAKAMENAGTPGASTYAGTGSEWCRFFGYASGGNGNRAVTSNSGQGLPLNEPAGFNTNNRITDAGWGYDGRGNVNQEPSGPTFAYDAENRQVAYCPSDASPSTCTQTAGNSRTLYYYDGEGHRVESSGPGGTTTFSAKFGPEIEVGPVKAEGQ